MSPHRIDARGLARIGLAFAAALLLCEASARAGDAATGNAETQKPATEEMSDDPEVQSAREAFLHGAALARQGRWSEATEAFERSYGLRRHPITSYNIGYCERAVGHYTRAHKMLGRALREHASGELGTLPERLLQRAHDFLAEADRSMGRLDATLKPYDARVVIDGRPLERETEGSAGNGVVLLAGTRDPGQGEPLPSVDFELLLDPGTHVIVLSKPGWPDTVMTAHVEAGEVATLKLLHRSAQPVPSDRKMPGPPETPWIDRRFAYWALGVGAVGTAVGGITGAMALHQHSVISRECNESACSASQASDIEAYHRYSNISTVSLGVGVLGLATGIVGLLVLPAPPQPKGALLVTPVIGVGWFGVTGRL